MPMNSSLALPRVAELPTPSLPVMAWPSGRGLMVRASDGLRPAQRRVVTGLIVLAHALGAWAVFNAQPVEEAPAEAPGSPMFVSLIAPVAPAVQPKPVPRVMPKAPTPPAARPLMAAPSPRPAVFQAPVVAEKQAPAPAPAPMEKAVEAPPSVAAAPEVAATPAPPPAPQIIPNSAVQYLKMVSPEYPAPSRRLGETGRVMLRVTIDEAGMPRDVQVSKSSGYARLDQAAMASTRQSRFKPYTQNGRPITIVTFAPLDFELEN